MTKQLNIKLASIAFIALIITSCKTESNASKSTNTDNPFTAQVDSILSLMTLEEKIGQLNLPVSGDITTGQGTSSNVGKKIKDGLVGGMFNIKSVEKIREVQKIAVE